MTKLIFLDIDGVLNNHVRNPAGHCGIRPENVAHFNLILDSVPDAQIVISSSWRYMIHKGQVTLRGFEYILGISGVKAWQRLHGHTSHDDGGPRFRLIHDYIAAEFAANNIPVQPVILDDMDIGAPDDWWQQFIVQTSADVGLTRADALRAIGILGGTPVEVRPDETLPIHGYSDRHDPFNGCCRYAVYSRYSEPDPVPPVVGERITCQCGVTLVIDHRRIWKVMDPINEE